VAPSERKTLLGYGMDLGQGYCIRGVESAPNDKAMRHRFSNNKGLSDNM